MSQVALEMAARTTPRPNHTARPLRPPVHPTCRSQPESWYKYPMLSQADLPITQVELLNRIRAGRADLLTILAQVPPQLRDQPETLGEWSLKDTIVHISLWNGQLVTYLFQLRNGLAITALQGTPNLDVDAINRRWFEQNRARPWALAWSDFNSVHNQLLRRVTEFSDAALNDPRLHICLRKRPLWEWIRNDTYEHDAEHAASIRAWLDLP
jgi:hypothetical protein